MLMFALFPWEFGNAFASRSLDPDIEKATCLLDKDKAC